MPRRASQLNFYDMVSWLSDEFKRDGYSISDIYEEAPNLPIDLICTKKDKGKQEFYFVIVAAINEISEDFQKRLFFYQYFLSLHYRPYEYKIILAVPSSAKVVTVPFYADEPEEKAKDFYEENGIGLWKITSKNNIDKTTCPATTLRERIEKDFISVIAKEDKKLLRKTSEIIPFVDKFIHHSVLGIAGFYPIEFTARYIDPTLLLKVLKLKKVPYRGLLFKVVSDHLSKKEKGDFDFCTDTLNKLWSEYLRTEIYPEEHRKLENLLVELYPEYRDHYVHQLQVFLLGALILDILLDNSRIVSKNGFPCISWLLASSFHDFSYPIEKYDDYVSRLFKECLGVKIWGFLGLKNDYTEYSFSSKVEHIINSVAECFTGTFQGVAGTDNCNKIRHFFYHSITKNKNHGLIGSIGLLKRFEDEKNIDFSDVILPASVAIALHDPCIYLTMHGSANNIEAECVSIVNKLAPLKKLSFEKQPLAFLLILCDNIQDWGRHFGNIEREKQLEEANIRLKDIYFDSDKIVIQLLFTNTPDSRKFIRYKKSEMDNLSKLLSISNLEFKIEYWDREKNAMFIDFKIKQ